MGAVAAAIHNVNLNRYPKVDATWRARPESGLILACCSSCHSLGTKYTNNTCRISRHCSSRAKIASTLNTRRRCLSRANEDLCTHLLCNKARYWLDAAVCLMATQMRRLLCMRCWRPGPAVSLLLKTIYMSQTYAVYVTQTS